MLKKVIQAYHIADENDRGDFWVCFIGVFIYLGITIWAIFESSEANIYYKLHNCLFMICLISFAVVLIGKRSRNYIFNQAKSVFDKKRDSELNNYTWLMYLFIFGLSIVAFLFVIDLSFLKNYGLRISGVVGVLIMRIIIDKIRYR
ncbi:MAG: hypothetical protein PHU23_14460 [Dehalococcoidales bacterium]|nr:hypothetical protein [Dehalococcoidales bacterium]